MVNALLADGEVWTNPLLVGLVVGLPTSAFGFLAYRRTANLDKTAAQLALVTTQGDAVQRVIDGLDQMVDNLQADNQAVRARVVELSGQLKECNEGYDELKRMLSG